MEENKQGKSGSGRQGFASMDAARRREIASKGGQSVPPEKRSFSQNRDLAAQAGRKGGENVAPEARSFSQDRSLAAQAGRKGGQSSHRANGGNGEGKPVAPTNEDADKDKSERRVGFGQVSAFGD